MKLYFVRVKSLSTGEQLVCVIAADSYLKALDITMVFSVNRLKLSNSGDLHVELVPLPHPSCINEPQVLLSDRSAN